MFSRRIVSGKTVTIRVNVLPFGIAAVLAIVGSWSKDLDGPRALTYACTLGFWSLVALKIVGDWKITLELARAMKRGNVTSTGSVWSLQKPMTHTFDLPDNETPGN